jgi:hypothetical protein
MGDSWWAAGALVLTAYLAAAAAWPARRLRPGARAVVLSAIAVIPISIPILCPPEPLLGKVLATLLCPVLGTRLLGLGVEAEWWRGRRLRDWLAALANPLVLVPRLHEGAPGRERAARPLLEGAGKVAAGAALLVWTFRSDAGRWPFWLEHSVKLLAAYLCFFDGMFVLQTGLLRLAGMRTLDLSRQPVLSVTPADFWRRYNCEAGRFLREDLYRPVEKSAGKVAGIAAVFAVNGILHEYMAWLLAGRVRGYLLAFFALHGAAVAVTWKWRPRGWAKGAAWAGTLLFVGFSSMLFFAAIQQFSDVYARR